jgi:signal peptidase I
MKPTIIEGDRIFVNKLAYDLKVPFTLLTIATWDEPAYGDIIVFDSPVENNRLVKRVIGVPGDVVEIRNNRVFVNGRPAHYALASQAAVMKYWPQNPRGPALYREGFGTEEHSITVMPRLLVPARNYGPVTVDADHFFVLGDNRDNSADSRYIGTIHRSYILGRANAVVASFRYLDRSLTALE